MFCFCQELSSNFSGVHPVAHHYVDWAKILYSGGASLESRPRCKISSCAHFIYFNKEQTFFKNSFVFTLLRFLFSLLAVNETRPLSSRFDSHLAKFWGVEARMQWISAPRNETDISSSSVHNTHNITVHSIYKTFGILCASESESICLHLFNLWHLAGLLSILVILYIHCYTRASSCLKQMWFLQFKNLGI
jgi:hypothetical protein